MFYFGTFVPVKVQEDLDFDPEQSTDSQTEALPYFRPRHT
jgi:hypothetical protein